MPIRQRRPWRFRRYAPRWIPSKRQGGVQQFDGHGDAAADGTSTLSVFLQLSGHGDAAASATGTMLSITRALTGHGDSASSGTGSLTTGAAPTVAGVALGISFRFRRTISESHTIKSILDVYHVSEDQPFAELEIVGDSSVTAKAGDATRRSADLTVIDTSNALTPANAEAVLDPFLSEVRVRSGIVYPDDLEELVSCGFYVIKRFQMVKDGGKRAYKIECFDRSKRATQQFGRPYSTIPGAALENVIADMLHFKAPTIPQVLTTTGIQVPALVFPGSSNPWAEALKLANWSGYTLEIDRDRGAITLTPTVTDVGKEAAWEFIDNSRAVAWEVESEFDSDDAPNHVIVRGGGSDTSDVYGEALDNDPSSLTYVGRIGYNTREYEDVRVTTNEQAKRAATRILGRDLGTAKTHPLKALPNPALNLDQTVRLTQTEYSLDVFALVEEITLPLVAGDDKHMDVTLRRGVRNDEDLLALVLST